MAMAALCYDLSDRRRQTLCAESTAPATSGSILTPVVWTRLHAIAIASGPSFGPNVPDLPSTDVGDTDAHHPRACLAVAPLRMNREPHGSASRYLYVYCFDEYDVCVKSATSRGNRYSSHDRRRATDTPVPWRLSRRPLWASAKVVQAQAREVPRCRSALASVFAPSAWRVPRSL